MYPYIESGSNETACRLTPSEGVHKGLCLLCARHVKRWAS
jgi:hypothetical protein